MSPSTTTSDESLKQVIKAALVEVLHEQRGFLREVFAEVLEDQALVKAIREAQDDDQISRDEVFEILKGRG